MFDRTPPQSPKESLSGRLHPVPGYLTPCLMSLYLSGTSHPVEVHYTMFLLSILYCGLYNIVDNSDLSLTDTIESDPQDQPTELQLLLRKVLTLSWTC